ncbi:hypothetical protein H2201_006827 [Coniosporium apollinis]|uniref:Mid2 domain-containing protein n=1 Tax=Coniosporium apollinis TaxID=61459 RepID=A0ABQ9NP85_9PEZI|nr:hypothetical protein H2201_006827 [Coniosporium apollinis]
MTLRPVGSDPTEATSTPVDKTSPSSISEFKPPDEGGLSTGAKIGAIVGPTLTLVGVIVAILALKKNKDKKGATWSQSFHVWGNVHAPVSAGTYEFRDNRFHGNYQQGNSPNGPRYNQSRY